MIKHTPGPWKAIVHNWSDSSIVGANGRTVARLSIADEATEEDQEDFEKMMADNANLFAAAPDLLDALEDMSERFKWCIDQLTQKGYDFRSTGAIAQSFRNAGLAIIKAKTGKDFTSAEENDMAESKYVLDVQRNVVGNCLLFYRKYGKGYTLNLDEAHEFTEQEAQDYVAQSNSKYRMWRKDVLEKVARLHVDESMAYAETNHAEKE